MKNTENIIKFLNIIQKKQYTLKCLKECIDANNNLEIEIINDLELEIQDFWNLVGIYSINNNDKDFFEASKKINSIINYKEPIDELELSRWLVIFKMI